MEKSFFIAVLMLALLLPAGVIAVTCCTDCCTPSSPCTAGNGDCDSNEDCTGSVCAYDVGSQYGCPRWVDVCVTTTSSSITTTSSTTTSVITTTTTTSATTTTTAVSTTTASTTTTTLPAGLPNCHQNRCTPRHPCTHGYGDCNSNADCTGSVCVYDVGLQYGCPQSVDICV